jgi:hypothetical protein
VRPFRNSPAEIYLQAFVMPKARQKLSRMPGCCRRGFVRSHRRIYRFAGPPFAGRRTCLLFVPHRQERVRGVILLVKAARSGVNETGAPGVMGAWDSGGYGAQCSPPW